MTDPIRRNEPSECRLPGDGDDHEAKAEPSADASKKESERLSSPTDIDWSRDDVHCHTPPTTIGPPAAPAAPAAPKPSTNNATRTAERKPSDGTYAAAGYAPGGHAFYAGTALVKGTAANGVQVEVGSVSGQVGLQHEAQAGGARVGYAGELGSVSAEYATVKAHVGHHNADGSRGMNIGVAATGVAAEATLTDGANSATFGVGAGFGAEGSLGLRDKDGNGQPEACMRVSFSFVTVGGCVELPIHKKM